MLTSFLLLTAVLAAFALTWAMRSYALRARVLDIPNSRSSHSTPTPRGGGLAIVAVVLAVLPLLRISQDHPITLLASLWLGGALVAAVGWLDDRRGVPYAPRIGVHLLAACLALVCLGGVPDLPLGGTDVSLGLTGPILAGLFICWMINLYNFMDGIDGIAGVEAVTVAAGSAGLLWWTGSPAWATVPLLYGSASLGFLFWNWPPGKIFLGDAGSGFLGFFLAVLAIATWTQAGLHIWAWLILLGAFIVDATLTLLRRIIRGQPFYQAHRTHAYQHAARDYGHLPVTVAVGLGNLLWLLPIAALSLYAPEWGLFWLLLAWTPLVWLCLWFRAGKPE